MLYGLYEYNRIILGAGVESVDVEEGVSRGKSPEGGLGDGPAAGLEDDEAVTTGLVMGGERIVEAVGQTVVVLEAGRGPHEDLLLKQQALRARNDRVLVLGQGIRCVTDLLDLVVYACRLRRAKLEPRAGLNAAEGWLIEEFRRAKSIVLGDVVHDLERRPA